MVPRLVLDVVRRKRTAIAFAAVQVYLFGRVIWDQWPWADPMAWLLAGVAFAAISPGSMLESRELHQLPVSRRAWWRARWWLATAGAVLVVQPGMMLAQRSALPHGPSGEWLFLSTSFAFLYGGCAMSLSATRLGRWADTPMVFRPPPAAAPAVQTAVRPVRLWWVILRAVVNVVPGMLAALAAPLVAPFIFARYLPHTFSAFNSLSVIVVLAMAVGAAWGYVYRPAIEARPSRRAPRPATAGAGRPTEAPEHSAATAPARFVDRLTGLRLPLWTLSRKYLITHASVIALGVAWWWVTSIFRAVPALSAVLGRAGMLPFASRSAHVAEPITVGALLLVASLLEVETVTTFRPLRTLPLSASRLGCIPVGLGLISAAMLWTVFLVLHALVLGTLPVSFRPDLFTAFAALTAFTQVLRVTLPGQPAARSLIAFVPVGVIWLALGYADSFRTDIVQPAMFFGGLLTLAASFALMRRAVAGSSRLYQPLSTPGLF